MALSSNYYGFVFEQKYILKYIFQYIFLLRYMHMSQRKLEDKNIRKLNKTGGNSITVTLPIEIIRKLGWKAKQKVVAKESGKGILITDWKK
jgi:hypothetical protein